MQKFPNIEIIEGRHGSSLHLPEPNPRNGLGAAPLSAARHASLISKPPKINIHDDAVEFDLFELSRDFHGRPLGKQSVYSPVVSI